MVYLDSMNLYGGKHLSQHQCDDSSPGPYIKDQSRLDELLPHPLNGVSTQHSAVGTHLHSCFTLLEIEAFHVEDGHKYSAGRGSEVEGPLDLIYEIRFLPGKELHLPSERPTIPVHKGLRRYSRRAADMAIGGALSVDRRLQVK